MPKVLVLGGTTEARRVSSDLLALDYDVTLALKGLTRNPGVPEGVTLRSGGFGGSRGLAAYLAESKTDLLVDATHPFAARMSQNAYVAGLVCNIPLLAVQRPGWSRRPGDQWKTVDTLPKAVWRLRQAASMRVLLALGGQGAELFRCCLQHRFQARVLVNSKTALATSSAHRWKNLEVLRIAQRRTIAVEMVGISAFGADLMIVRDAGGVQDAKLEAARRLSLPVWLIDRPAMPPVPIFSSPSALLEKLIAGKGTS